MGVPALDYRDDDGPRMPRLPSHLRADESKNRAKFGKAHSSLSRLPAGSQIHRKRIQRVMQLSTMGPMRIAPDTVEGNGTARPIDMQRHRESRLMQDQSDVASMTPEDLDETRMAVRQRALWERLMATAPGMLMAGYEDEQLGKAEEFAATFDSISRTTHDGPSNVQLIDLPWKKAGYHSRES
jgi:hypothetical protein